MKKIVLTPNPYRDRNFKYVTLADKLLREAGLETRICLAFDVDRSFELPDNVVLTELNHELRDADLLVCFGGDGTILHASKAATKAGIPVLGVNIGTMGFMAELESSELKELRRLADDDFSVEPRMMLHVRAEHEGRVILEEDALNDAVITKGAVARVVQMSVQGDGVDMMSFSGDGLIVCTPTGSTAYSGWRPAGRACCTEYCAHADLRPRYADTCHRYVCRPRDHGAACPHRPQKRLSFRGRRQGCPPEQRRSHYHTPL